MGGALLRILSVHAALQERGWGVVLGLWHACVVAVCLGQRNADAAADQRPDRPTTPLEIEADLRWRRLCSQRGVAHDDPAAVLDVLRELGIVERRRRLLAERWAMVEPVPDASTSPHLGAEARHDATAAAHRFEVGMAVAGLLEAGDGCHRAASWEELVRSLDTDRSVLDVLAVEHTGAWRIVEQPDGAVTVEQVEDAALDEALAALDTLPDDPEGAGRWRS